jgi:hypothetical protein
VTAATVRGVLAGRPATPAACRLVQLAIDGGLRPHQMPGAKADRGLFVILLSYPATWGLFGAIHVSAETGDVDHVTLCPGNAGTDSSYDARQAAGQLAAWKTAARQKCAHPRRPCSAIPGDCLCGCLGCGARRGGA